MNPAGLSALAGATSEEELIAALERLLTTFGAVKSIRLLHNEDHAEFLCFAELADRQLHVEVIRQLGGSYFGDGMVFRIPSKPEQG